MKIDTNSNNNSNNNNNTDTRVTEKKLDNRGIRISIVTEDVDYNEKVII